MQTAAMPVENTSGPAEIAISQAEARQRYRQRWLIAGGIVSMIVSYPLSFGSLLYFDDMGFVPDSLYGMLRIVYAPMIILIRSVPSVAEIYECLLGIDI